MALKAYTLEELKDDFVGPIGSPERIKYEEELVEFANEIQLKTLEGQLDSLILQRDIMREEQKEINAAIKRINEGLTELNKTYNALYRKVYGREPKKIYRRKQSRK